MPLTFKEAHSLINGARPHWYLWSEATSEPISGAGSVGTWISGQGLEGDVISQWHLRALSGDGDLQSLREFFKTQVLWPHCRLRRCRLRDATSTLRARSWVHTQRQKSLGQRESLDQVTRGLILDLAVFWVQATPSSTSCFADHKMHSLVGIF